MFPYLLTTLAKFKVRISKSGSTNDDKILSIIQEASGIADRFTGRRLRIRTYGTDDLDAEYGSGDGSDIFQTREWPIVSVTSVHDDTSRLWESTTLKASTDYLLRKDKGWIQLQPQAVKGHIWQDANTNVKLVYTAGYGLFQIISSVNDKIDFEDTAASEVSVTVAAGLYEVADLITAIDTAMTAGGASAYTITYSYNNGTFTIISDRAGGDGTFKLLTNSGSNVGTSIWSTLGFSTLSDNADTASHTGGNGVIGIPSDLEEAVLEIAMRIYNAAPGLGGAKFDIASESQGGTAEWRRNYNEDELPTIALKTLIRYKRAET